MARIGALPWSTDFGDYTLQLVVASPGVVGASSDEPSGGSLLLVDVIQANEENMFITNVVGEVSGQDWDNGCSVGVATGRLPLPRLSNYVVGRSVSGVQVPDAFLHRSLPGACPPGWILGDARRWAWGTSGHEGAS